MVVYDFNPKSFEEDFNFQSSTKDNFFTENTLKAPSSSKRPIPVDKEISLDPTKTIMSKTDSKGVIEYANEYFMEISGYEEWELMGKPHNIVRHPDMPKTIFKLLWDYIQDGKNIHAFVKNMAKDGRYYWVLTNFEIKKDPEGNITSYYARRKAAPRNVLHNIQKLYYTLKTIEDKQGMKTALAFFNGMLEEKRMTYDQFILDLLGTNEDALYRFFYDIEDTPNAPEKEQVKKSFLKRMFS